MLRQTMAAAGVLLLLASCAHKTPEPPVAEEPSGFVLKEPVRLTLTQRTSKVVEALGRNVRLEIRDITGGQVLIRILEKDKPILDLTSMKPGDVVPFTYRKARLYLVVIELRNFLIGNDFGVFEISPTPPPPPSPEPPPLLPPKQPEDPLQAAGKSLDRKLRA